MLISLLFQQPHTFFLIILAILYTLSVHEYMHAQMAVWFGDDTPKMMGRLTLNPLKHVDVFGFIMLLVVGFGWGKPVLFNPMNIKNKKWGSAWVAMAGPAANLASLLFLGLVYRFLAPVLGATNLLTHFLMWLIIYNSVFLTFNLLPIPPLDGSKILFAILPERFHSFKITLSRQGPFILIALVIMSNLFGLPIFSSIFIRVINLCQYAFGSFPLIF